MCQLVRLKAYNKTDNNIYLLKQRNQITTLELCRVDVKAFFSSHILYGFN